MTIFLSQLAHAAQAGNYAGVERVIKAHPNVCSQINRPVRRFTDWGWTFANAAARAIYTHEEHLHAAVMPYYRCESGRIVSTHTLRYDWQRTLHMPQARPNMFRLLAENKADLSSPVKIQTNRGESSLTLLMHAILCEDLPLVRALLELKADAGIETENGGCALRTVQPCAFVMGQCAAVVRASYSVSLPLTCYAHCCYQSDLFEVLHRWLSPDTAGLVVRYCGGRPWTAGVSKRITHWFVLAELVCAAAWCGETRIQIGRCCARC